MPLLVSLCSRTQVAPEALIAYEPSDQRVVPVSLPDPGHGVLGLCLRNGIVYCVVDRGRPTASEPELSELYALDADTLSIRWRYGFQIGRDVHSIASGDGGLYAVSTGTDELLFLELDGEGVIARETVYWQPDPEGGRQDLHHLNSVRSHSSSVIVSGLGKKPSPSAQWRAARAGFVEDVVERRRLLGPLYHPHSLCWLENELAVCESPFRRVVSTSGRQSTQLPGYARGLCVEARNLYVGASRGRRPQEAPSILAYEDGISESADTCAICHLDVTDLTLKRLTSLEPHGREVYDIIAIPG